MEVVKKMVFGEEIVIPPFGCGVEFRRVNDSLQEEIVMGVSRGTLNGSALEISFGGHTISTNKWKSLLHDNLCGERWREEWDVWGREKEVDSNECIVCAEIGYPVKGEKAGLNGYQIADTIKNSKGRYFFFWSVDVAGRRTGAVFIEAVNDETMMASFTHMSENPVNFVVSADSDICWIAGSKVYATKKEAKLSLLVEEMSESFP